MILDKLHSIEKDTTRKIEHEKERLRSLKNFIDYLNQIDFEYEEVRLDDNESLSNLLTSLKGNTLDKNENELLIEITKQ